MNRFSVNPLGGLNVGGYVDQTIKGGRQQYRINKMQEEAPKVFESGNPSEIARFMIKYPEMADTMKQATGVQAEGQEKELVDLAKGLLTPGIEHSEVIVDYAKKLTSSGRDPKMAVSMLSKIMSDPAKAQEMGEKLLAIHAPDDFVNYQRVQGKNQSPTKQKTGAWLVRLEDGSEAITTGVFDSKDGTLTTATAKIPAAQVLSKVGETPAEETTRKITQKKGELQAELEAKPKIEGQVTRAKEEEKRAGDLIERGVLAAESTAVLRRGINLLETIKTGGFANAKYQAKRIFGVESANEGELASNLGKAVLSQLRETFGAQFTENEGARLSRIEASLGKSTEANKRLLQQALRISEKVAKRARKVAEERGDESTVADIDDLLSFELGDPGQEPENLGELDSEELEKIAFGKK